MLGCRVDEENEAGETKTRSERIKRVPIPTPQSQSSSSPLFEQKGSAICDWFYELISERRVSPCQDSTEMLKFNLVRLILNKSVSWQIKLLADLLNI